MFANEATLNWSQTEVDLRRYRSPNDLQQSLIFLHVRNFVKFNLIGINVGM